MKGYPTELQDLHDIEYDSVLTAINNALEKTHEKNLFFDHSGERWEAFYHIGLYVFDKHYFLEQVSFLHKILLEKRVGWI